MVGFFGAALVADAVAGLLPLFLAAHFAFIRAESLALAAADIGLRAVVTLPLATVVVEDVPAWIFAHRALAAARSLAFVASDIPELDWDFDAAPLEPKVEESSRWSFSICSLI